MQLQKMLTLASEVCVLAWYWSGCISIRQFLAKGYQKEKKTFQEIDEMTWTLAHIYYSITTRIGQNL